MESVKITDEVFMSKSIEALCKAFVAVQPHLVMPEKDTTNPFFKSKYSTLDACIEANRRILSERGLAISQLPTGKGAEVKVSTLMLHDSGEYIMSNCTALAKAADPQAVGSGITYLRRYSYLSVLGIASKDEDDDGHEASQPASQPQGSPMIQSFAEIGVTEAMLSQRLGKPVSKASTEDKKALGQIYEAIRKGAKVEEFFKPSPADQINRKFGGKSA